MSEYRTKPRWTRAQVTILEANYGTMSDEDLATMLGRTVSSIRHKRLKLDLLKESGRGIIKPLEKKDD